MKIKTCLGMSLAWLLSMGSALAEPVAMVTDVGGGVFLSEGASQKKVALLDYLEPKTMLRLDANAMLSVTFFSKPVEYRFTGPARLVVEQDRVTVSEGAAETRAVSLTKTTSAKKYTAAQREHVAHAAYEMRAGRPGLRLNDPVDTRVIAGDVGFSWDGPQPAEGCRLTLYDHRKKRIHQVSLTGNDWTPAAGLLKPGRVYEWEVSAALKSGEELIARGSFSVADAAAAKNIRAQSPQADASFSDRLLYAVFLEEQGFRYDARRVWQELSKERPDDPVVLERSQR